MKNESIREVRDTGAHMTEDVKSKYWKWMAADISGARTTKGGETKAERDRG